jgi:hypothetical protein
VVSPILANLFLHYAFDRWISKTSPQTPFERYADDAIIHCSTEDEAVRTLKALDKRLQECKLTLHPDKTKIVYCNKTDTHSDYPNQEFDFLGYTFKRMFIKDRTGRLQYNFLCKVSKKSAKSFRDKVKDMKLQKRVGSSLKAIAVDINPTVRGWLNYFMKYQPSGVRYSMDCLNRRITRWAMRKYKRLRGQPRKAERWLRNVAKREPNLFAHWALGMLPT